MSLNLRDKSEVQNISEVVTDSVQLLISSRCSVKLIACTPVYHVFAGETYTDYLLFSVHMGKPTVNVSVSQSHPSFRGYFVYDTLQ